MTLEIGKSLRVKGYIPGVRGYIGHRAEADVIGHISEQILVKS